MAEILVAVRASDAGGGDLAGPPIPERFAERVEELGEGLGEIANRLRDQLEASLAPDQEQRWQLDELQLTFSLDLQSEAGVIVARATASAGFEAALTWRRRSRDERP